MTKTEYVGARVTKIEKRDIEYVCEMAGMSFSEIVIENFQRLAKDFRTIEAAKNNTER